MTLSQNELQFLRLIGQQDAEDGKPPNTKYCGNNVYCRGYSYGMRRKETKTRYERERAERKQRKRIAQSADKQSNKI